MITVKVYFTLFFFIQKSANVDEHSGAQMPTKGSMRTICLKLFKIKLAVQEERSFSAFT